MTQGNTPPGWYDDGSGTQRWWDGQQWAESPAAPQSSQQSPQQSSGETPEHLQPGQQPGQSGQPGQPGQQPGYGGGYPGGPGYPGAPGGTGGPKKSKGLLFAILGVVALLVVGAVVALVLVLGGDDDDSSASDGPSSSNPEDTVEAFFDAAKEGDCDKAEELVSQRFLDEAGEDCDEDDFDPEEAEDVEYEVGDAEIDGDEATVPVDVSEPNTTTGEDDTYSLDVKLVKEDDKWLIDDFGFGDTPDAPTASTVTPSDFPSDLPSDFPSDLPSDFPSDFPTDIPTDFLSDLPSDFPSDLLSDLPSDFPTE